MPTVLIVDDSLSVRKVAERVLKEAGLTVALAANGEAAVSWLSTHQPDMVITDVIMPDMSGFEVCAFIRAQAHLATLPVLLFSGFVDDDVTRKAEACKADGVVKKPFQGTSFCEQVMALLAARMEQGVRAPEPVSAMPAAEPVLELAVPVTESTVRLPVESPSHSPAPSATPSPLETFRDDRRILREIIAQLEARVAEQAHGLAQLERHVQEMHRRLEDEEQHVVELRTRLADLEPAAASAKQALQALTDFARQVLIADGHRTP